jgi:hypothetical protein
VPAPCPAETKLSATIMLDREKILAMLRRRFAGASTDQIAAAANTIVGLDDDWEELSAADAKSCAPHCYLARAVAGDTSVKVLKRGSVD